MANLVEADTDVFHYTGGRIPEDQRAQIIHVVVDESVSVIEDSAFEYCESLLSVKLHEGVVKIGRWTFAECCSLRRIKLPGVKIIGVGAFYGSESLVDVDFGGKLETIDIYAFERCLSLTSITMPPSVRSIGNGAFADCRQLSVAEFGEGLETIGRRAFECCKSLTRIAIPVKEGLVPDPFGLLENCPALTTVEVVGGIHKTIASLHLEKWKKEMVEEIEQINLVLPNTPPQHKTSTIINWMEGILTRLTHYKREHSMMVTEAINIVDDVVWGAKGNGTIDIQLNEEGEPKNKKRRIISQPEEDGTIGGVEDKKYGIIEHIFSYL